MMKNLILENCSCIEIKAEEYTQIEGGSVFTHIGRWVGRFIEEVQNGDHSGFMNHSVGVGAPV